MEKEVFVPEEAIDDKSKKFEKGMKPGETREEFVARMEDKRAFELDHDITMVQNPDGTLSQVRSKKDVRKAASENRDNHE
jgi:hypothetical protein